MSEAARERGVLIALILFSVAVLWPLRAYGLQMGNDGWLLHPTVRMLEGEILYRDVLTYYAPLRYHLFESVFALFGPSFLVSRTVWLLMLVATSALTFRLGRRLLPVWLAWVPPVVYVLAPGPWVKAPYAFCSVIFFLALARALERPGWRRRAVMGAACGFTLAMRHELGLAQLAIAVVAAAIPALCPERFGLEAPRRVAHAARDAGVVVAVAVASVLPIVAYYAVHDALGPLVQMMFVNGFGQMPDWVGPLRQLLSPASFAQAREGHTAGLVLIAPVCVYALVALLLLVRLRRDGLEHGNVLIGALLAYGAATLPQVYSMPVLIRLLQSALPFYVLGLFLTLETARWFGRVLERPEHSALRFGVPGIAIVAGAWLVWFVNTGMPVLLPGDEFSGSMRMRRHRTPVEILGGDTVHVPWERAEELRLVRGFLDANAAPAEPVLALPLLSSYYALLGRPNPTGIVGEPPRTDNSVMSQAQKEVEMQRLLDSEARFVIASRYWLSWPDPPEHMRAVLRDAFHPIRMYGSVVVLERGSDEVSDSLAEILLRLERGQPDTRDVEALRDVIRARPDWPLPLQLLVYYLMRERDVDGALAALTRAFELDPLDVTPLESAAGILVGRSRFRQARDVLLQVHAVRESQSSKVLWESIPASIRDR